MPPGQRSDRAGNTVGCRLHFAESAAVIEKEFNCSAAGPGGNGVCGENCDGFCAIDHAVCPEIYATADLCQTACATFPATGTSYNDSIQTGNTVECRLYHVTAAAGIDAPSHCPHTDVGRPGPPCGAGTP